MSNEPFSIRPIAKGVEAREFRTLVFDGDFKLRPLLIGESVGEVPDQRMFQEVHAGDFIITTTKDRDLPTPKLRVTRHREKAMIGVYAVEVLNRIPGVLSRYLMDYTI